MRAIAFARWALMLAVVGAVSGCLARSPEVYRDDTTKLLATKGADLDTCYDTVAATNPTAAGKVTVTFTVEKKTGKIADVKADPARSTAPQPLIDCVTTAINGLVLVPPDDRVGMATFEYNFARASAAPAAAAPAAAAPAAAAPPAGK
jgi:hypothetical protein